MGEKCKCPELRHCPFCGSHWLEPETNENDIDEGVVTTRIVCAACGSAGPHETSLEEAIEAWNRRERQGDEEETYGDTKIVKKN